MDRQTETNHWFSFSRRIHHPKEISCSRLRGTWWLKVDFIGIWAITTSYPHYPGDQELTGFGHATYFGERGLLRSEILPNHWIVLVWLGVKRVGGVREGGGILKQKASCGQFLGSPLVEGRWKPAPFQQMLRFKGTIWFLCMKPFLNWIVQQNNGQSTQHVV